MTELVKTLIELRAKARPGPGTVLDELRAETAIRNLCFNNLDTIIAALSHEGMGFDLVAHLDRQMTFSARTFGPDPRQPGVCDHIRRELVEVENAPTPEERLKEWIDVILLGLDGAWRSQIETGLPKSWVISLIVEALEKKQTRNENRTWPDWRTMPTDKAIEHLPSLINEGGRE